MTKQNVKSTTLSPFFSLDLSLFPLRNPCATAYFPDCRVPWLFIYKAHTEPEQDYTISSSNIFVNFLCSVRHYNGVGGKSALILLAQGGSVREYI
jgi:hypothetical protein